KLLNNLPCVTILCACNAIGNSGDILAIVIDLVPATRIQALAYPEELSCNVCRTNLAFSTAGPPQVLQQCKLSSIAHFIPALNKKMGIKGSLSLSVQLFKLPASLHSRITSPTRARWRLQGFINLLKPLNG